jgi:hypothetical protein
MQRLLILVTLLLIAHMVPALPCSAGRRISVDIGYVETGSTNFGSGLTYGATITEGTGRIGFAITFRRFSNSISYSTEVKSGEDTIIFDYEEEFSDFYISAMPTYNFWLGSRSNHMLLGFGPQVHFVRSEKFYISDGFSMTARDFRLGAGVVLRYERRMDMFGGVAFALTAGQSWSEDRSDHPDPYDYKTPPEAISFPILTAGLAFSF